MTKMTVSQDILDYIKNYEDLKLTAYDEESQIGGKFKGWTIGYRIERLD